ncbi:CMP-sialic acid transporter (CMP-SA-Tr) (CMP-Sia-Tr) (Solute carrier family 35 member A1) [Durusdinium trenchii]|uniref:CMP-sialic acid transporter (CMP-SA-Tr) (CMP-Sia-Tr) (Solute carrier family 35 member A1) n=1 Tax=Durusdinium trenchii TaxID=1381693 RepID=A0ABP0S2R6_9DINO
MALALALVAQNAAAVLLSGRLRRGADAPPAPAELVVCVEWCKLMLSLGGMVVMSSHDTSSKARTTTSSTTWSWRRLAGFGVPAALYMVQNELILVALGLVNAGVFQLFYQAKVAWTALVAKAAFGRDVGWPVGAVSVGLALVSLAEMPEAGWTPSETWHRGVGATLLAGLLSALAGTWTEWLLKSGAQRSSVWVDNAVMSALTISLLSLRDGPVWPGRTFSTLAWAVVVVHAVGGIIIAHLLLSHGAVDKSVATALSTVAVGLVTLTPSVSLMSGATLVLVGVVGRGWPSQLTATTNNTVEGKKKNRWIPDEGFCRATFAKREDEGEAIAPCGCCFAKKESWSELELLSRATGGDVKLGLRGVFSSLLLGEGAPRVSFDMTDGAMERFHADFELAGSKASWSFRMSGKPAEVMCDKTGRCRAELLGVAHSPDVDEVIPPKRADNGEADAVFLSHETAAVVTLEFDAMSEKLEVLRKDVDNPALKVRVDGKFVVSFKLVDLDDRLASVVQDASAHLELELAGEWTRVPQEWTVPPVIIWPFPLQEENFNLCVQPVRIRHRDCAFKFLGICFGPTYRYTGDGLNFGRPGADAQWAKADISFTWKPWVTVIDNAGKYESVTEGAEQTSLRAEYNDASCIEVFFVPKFSPSSLHGGGATWGSGTANAKIITSDEMVSCGVDQMHLAHELGHVLGLMHPGTGHATFADGSSGTLLCPSGWERDNPRRNSWDNKNNVVNPLLTCYMDTWDWLGMDCTSSADCGACVLPSDSC